jgi:hypothetical protein
MQPSVSGYSSIKEDLEDLRNVHDSGNIEMSVLGMGPALKNNGTKGFHDSFAEVVEKSQSKPQNLTFKALGIIASCLNIRLTKAELKEIEKATKWLNSEKERVRQHWTDVQVDMKALRYTLAPRVRNGTADPAFTYSTKHNPEAFRAMLTAQGMPAEEAAIKSARFEQITTDVAHTLSDFDPKRSNPVHYFNMKVDRVFPLPPPELVDSQGSTPPPANPLRSYVDGWCEEVKKDFMGAQNYAQLQLVIKDVTDDLKSFSEELNPPTDILISTRNRTIKEASAVLNMIGADYNNRSDLGRYFERTLKDYGSSSATGESKRKMDVIKIVGRSLVDVCERLNKPLSPMLENYNHRRQIVHRSPDHWVDFTRRKAANPDTGIV